jgi:sulfatase modifying factor 1
MTRPGARVGFCVAAACAVGIASGCGPSDPVLIGRILGTEPAAGPDAGASARDAGPGVGAGDAGPVDGPSDAPDSATTATADATVPDAPEDATSVPGNPDAGDAGVSDASDAGCSPDGSCGPLSCQAGGDGLTNCGANSESCCTSLVVEGGTFYRNYDLTGLGGLTLAADGGPTAEADPATISTFRLDKYEVTVGRFRQFVNAWDGGSGRDGGPGYIPPVGSGKHAHLNGGNGLNATGGLGGASDAGYAGYEPGWRASDSVNVAPTDVDLDCVGLCTYGVNALDGVGQPIGTWNEFATWTPSPGNNERLPIDSVNWYEAYAFCIWDGGFLPCEAEWEYAAAGGSDQREYPWGAPATGVPDSRYAIYFGDYGDGGALSHIAPVGTAALGAGRWGQLDLLGNVYEWTLDYYSGQYFDPCTDCSDGTPVQTRVFHGGDFDSLISVGIPSYRLSENPALRPWTEGAWPTSTPTSPMAGSTVGFRCARTP